VFSPSNKEHFLEYLEQLETDFHPRYQKKVEELYGLEWINSTTKLY
jgi:hypothetical protein